MLISIGTTHPWNTAGVGLDARVAAEYGLPHGTCVVAVSAQDGRGLHALAPIDPQTIAAQLNALGEPHAVRIGALVSSDAVRIAARYVRGLPPAVPVVVDPVLGASLGGELEADDAFETTLAEELLTLPVIVTPNLIEAAELLETPSGDAASWAKAFVARGARAALVKGGHGDGDPVDVLADEAGVRSFAASRLPGSMRGTGCTLAASLACELLRGRDLDDAVARAREYVRSKIAAQTMRGGMQVAF